MSELLLLSIFPAAMALAAASDLFSMTISNRICIGFAAAFFLMAIWCGMEPWSILMHTTAGLGMLALGFGLFAMGWIGGGDAKLFAATAVWLGWSHLFEYAVWASFAGGALTILLVLARGVPLPARLEETSWAKRLHDAGRGVPYGIALAIAGIMVYPSTAWFGLVVN
jgi:prepilin peptidase CpaA